MKSRYALWGGHRGDVQIGSAEDRSRQRYRRAIRGMRQFLHAMEELGDVLRRAGL